jgi:hypothetical protein
LVAKWVSHYETDTKEKTRMAAQCIEAMLCQMLRPSSSYGHAAQARGLPTTKPKLPKPKAEWKPTA